MSNGLVVPLEFDNLDGTVTSSEHMNSIYISVCACFYNDNKEFLCAQIAGVQRVV